MAAAASTSLTNRMIRAASLDSALYEEVEADTTATSQALTVVVLAALAAGVGAAGAAALDGRPFALPGELINALLRELIGWVVWSFVLYFVGTQLFGGRATYEELLRALGFAYAPGVLLVLSFVPVLGALVLVVVGIWRLVTGFIAARQALDLDNGRTLATIVVGLIAYIVIAIVIALLLAPFYALGALFG